MSFYLIIYFLLLGITLVILFKKQKITPYLRIGWFFNLLTFAYYGFPLFYVIFWANKSVELLNRRYSVDFLEDLSLILLVCQVSFFLGEIFGFKRVYPSIESKEQYLIKAKYIYILLGLTYVMFFYRWMSVGGFLNIITQTRVEYMNDVGESSNLLSRYDIVFYIVTALIINNICIGRDYLKKNKVLTLLYLLFLILTVFMGTRLILFTVIICLFSGMFLFKRAVLYRNRTRILVGCVLLLFAFSAFATVRTELTSYFSGGKVRFEKSVSLVPTELFTGLLSHHSIENGVAVDKITFLQRMLPNTISSMMGTSKTIPFTQEIADQSLFTSGRAVYTVPYLTDIYFSVNKSLFVLWLTSLIIYLSFSYLQFKLYKYNILYLLLLYVLVYYILRVESPVWFGRFYTSYILLYVILLIVGKKIYSKL